MDAERFVEQAYQDKLGHGSLGMEWVRVMGTRSKVMVYPRGKLARNVDKELRESHFDPDDVRFVRLAMVTKCRLIITHDTNDFSNRVCKILRDRLDVGVHQTAQICDHIRANHLAEPTV